MQLFGTKGQKFLHCPGTKGQAILQRDGPGFFETVPSRPGTSRGTKSPSIFHIYAVFKVKIKKKNILAIFWPFFGPFCPAGRPGTEDLVLGFFLLFLSRDKGTAGQGNFFCPQTSLPLETLVGMEIY